MLIVSLATAAPYLSQRWQDEARTYRHVAVAVDFEEWADLAYACGGDLAGFLAEVRAAGVNQLSLKEPTIGRLEREGRVTIYDPATGAAPPADLPWVPEAGTVYLQAGDAELFAGLELVLPGRLDPAGVIAAPPYIAVAVSGTALREVRGTFLSADLALAERLGYSVFLRPSNARGISPALLLPVLPAGTVVLHQGQEVLGYPDLIGEAAAVLQQRGYILGLLEDPLQLSLVDQEGLDELYEAVLAHAGVAQAVRVHSFTEAELKKLSPADLVDRSLRGVRDRGIGVLFLKAMVPLPGQHSWASLTGPGLEYYGGLCRDLTAQRYVIGPAEPNRVPDWALAAYAGIAGAMGGCWIIAGGLLDLIKLPRRLNLLLLGSPLAVPVLALLAGKFGGVTMLREAAALMVALALPTAAVALAAPLVAGNGRPSLARGLLGLTAAVVLSIAGGLLVGASLAGPYYTLEFGYFRGVKLAHLVPAGFAFVLGVLMVWRQSEGEPVSVTGLGDDIRSLARLPVTWLAAALVGVVAVAAYVVLGRTGHTEGFQVSAIEVAIRDLFDVRLLARPRFKEILIGAPAMLGLAAVGISPAGRWPALFPLGLAAAAIGQVSVANSFSHIRTPLAVSLIRSLNGYWVGIVLTVVGLGLAWLAWRALVWLGRDG